MIAFLLKIVKQSIQISTKGRVVTLPSRKMAAIKRTLNKKTMTKTPTKQILLLIWENQLNFSLLPPEKARWRVFQPL